MKTFTKLAAAAAVTALTASGAIAATNPATATVNQSGGTGLADLIISIDKGELMRISGIDDIYLGAFAAPLAADATGSDAMCVYTTLPSGAYNLTANSANALGANYRMTDGASFMTYTITWDDTVGGPVALAHNTPTGFLGANIVSDTCGGGSTGTLGVTVSIANFAAAATNGAYSDTLTLLIENP